MTSKKMWQTLPITLVFMLVSALTAQLAFLLFSDFKWPLSFGIGAAFMAASVVLSLMREKLPRLSWLALLLNSLACGFLIASFIIGKKAFLSVPPQKVFLVLILAALVTSAFYLVLMLLLTVPRLKDKKAYIIFSYFLYLAAALCFGVLFLNNSFEKITGIAADETISTICFLFFVAAAALALGSLFRADGLKELLFALVTPSTFSVGFIAVVVLMALACGDGGDCDCGGDCCSGCDCSPNYGKKNPKSTTMSGMSEP